MNDKKKEKINPKCSKNEVKQNLNLISISIDLNSMKRSNFLKV